MLESTDGCKVPTVSIIIPTLCQASRERLLFRAISSIVSQLGMDLEIIIVINGDIFDSRLVKLLEEDGRFIIIRLAKANVSEARYAGVCSAKGDFFGFLDDDDELLSHALRDRLVLARKHPEADIIVTNGFCHSLGKDSLAVEHGIAVGILHSPVDVFFQQNWFASSASLFNAKTIKSELFDFSLKYFEWTYLFFLLVSKGKHFYYDEALTYRTHKDTPSSISKTTEYALAYPDILLKLLTLPLSLEVRNVLTEKYISALNMKSDIERMNGQLIWAWRSHLKCLISGGWRYLSYTRHLVKSSFRSRV